MKDKNNQHIIDQKQQAEKEGTNDTISLEYITSRLDMIIKKDEYIKMAIENITNMKNMGDNMFTGGAQATVMSNSIKGIVGSREITNQKVIEFLNKMYDDKMGKTSDSKMNKQNLAEKLLSNPGLDTDMLPDILASISNL